MQEKSGKKMDLTWKLDNSYYHSQPCHSVDCNESEWMSENQIHKRENQARSNKQTEQVE